MDLMAVLTIIAIFVSPVVAVWVSRSMQDRREQRQQQFFLLTTLIANRRQGTTHELVRSLNMIDLVFHDKQDVRRLWHEYFDMLCNDGLNNPAGWEQRNKKNIELITEMARVLGYGKVISHLDVDRVYSPVGAWEEFQNSRKLRDELLRVLEATGSVQTTPRRSDSETDSSAI